MFTCSLFANSMHFIDLLICASVVGVAAIKNELVLANTIISVPTSFLNSGQVPLHFSSIISSLSTVLCTFLFLPPPLCCRPSIVSFIPSLSRHTSADLVLFSLAPASPRRFQLAPNFCHCLLRQAVVFPSTYYDNWFLFLSASGFPYSSWNISLISNFRQLFDLLSHSHIQLCFSRL